MKKNGQEYLQCGYEDNCKKKDCLKCLKKHKHDFSKLKITLAEEIAMEEFGMCDISGFRKAELKLDQDLIRSAIKKIWNCEKD